MKHLSSSLLLLSAAVAGTSTAQAQSVLARCTGSSSYAGLGSSLAVLGDIDGDGVPELALAASGERVVHVVSGASGAQLYAVPDPHSGGYTTFGIRVRAVGDVDADGQADFIVPSWAESSYDGAAYVYSGANGALLYSYHGASGARLGRDADGVGDIDADGHADFIIGADGEGTARVYSGASGAVLCRFVIPGGANFGAGVGGVGDVDGDGIPDFAVGLPFAEAATGAVYVISGRTRGRLFRIVNSVSGNGTFARTIVGAGDVNGDGHADIAVGDSHWGNGFTGSVWIYSGVDGSLLRRLTGEGCTGDGDPSVDPDFGNEFAAVGDLDHDGVTDLGVGGLNEARVFSGATGALLRVFHEPAAYPGSAGDVLSTAVASLPDLDGDGSREIVVGWRLAPAGLFPRAGRVTWYADDAYPAAGTLLALGDGSGTPCPCGNTGQSQAGCANSTGQGAELRAWGSISLAQDTFYLEANDVRPLLRAVLFCGTQPVNGGLGVPFYDGLMGAGGALLRLPSQLSCSDGRALFGPGLAQAGLWLPGQSRVFQVWYRDPGGPCGTSVNLSNAVQLTFAP